MQIKNNKKNRGYTIIETMIAISIFLVIIMVGMGALLNGSSVHKKSQDMRSIMDNLSFIMEDISRNLRTGYNYYCITGVDNLSDITDPKSCQNGWGIAFESSSGNISNPNDQWAYKIENNIIKRSTSGGDGVFIDLSPSEVIIDGTKSSFTVIGAEPPSVGNNRYQPFVIIRLVGKINYKGIESPFDLQTSVSQRLLDR